MYSRRTNLVIAVLFAWFGLSLQSASAQPSLSKNRKHVVYKTWRDGQAPDQDIADFDDREAAWAYRNQLMDSVQLSDGFYYSVRERAMEPRNSSPPRPRPQPPADRPGVITAAQRLAGKTLAGYETASDTTSLKFIFDANGSVTAYDDSATVWTGTWRTIGETNVVIQLTSPHEVNYSGQLQDGVLSGSAGRPGGGKWSFKVTLQ